jgi:hypothetical protein
MEDWIQEIEATRANWLKASKEIGFKIFMPFTMYVDDKEIDAFAFLPCYGAEKGIIIDLIFPPFFDSNDSIKKWADDNGYGYSFLNIEVYSKYDKDFFVETLNDWGKFNNQEDKVHK